MATWEQRVKTTVTGASVSAHLEVSLKLGFALLLPKADVTPVSLEFGTASPMEIFRAARAENWPHHHAGCEKSGLCHSRDKQRGRSLTAK